MVRLIAAAILVLGSLGAVNGADACSPEKHLTEEEMFKYADEIFHALVVRTTLSDEPFDYDGRRGLIEAKYEILEVFKGLPNRDWPVVSTNLLFGGCGLPLFAGQEYVFYVNKVSASESAIFRFVDILDGSRILSPNREHKERTIEEIREIKRRVEELDRLGYPPHAADRNAR